MRQFRQRIDLIHELAQLRTAKEIADDRRERLGINQFLGPDRFDALIEKRHAFLDEAFGAGEADAALVGEQFAHGADTAAAEVVNVVETAFTFFEAKQIFRGGDKVVLGQNARVIVLEAEFLVDLIATNTAKVIALGI